MDITIRGLVKKFYLESREIPVLKGIDWHLSSGDLVSLTGPSGAGKSTLLHLIGTLDKVTQGEIQLGNQSVSHLSAAELATFRNQNIGFIFQFHHLLPEFTALENVAMPLLMRREKKAVAEQQASHFLEKVGLGKRMQHRPGELSGGEQQRVALARAFVTQPKILLADEPTGNLDEATGMGIFSLIKELNEEHRVTTLIVTHHPGLAQKTQKQYRLTVEGLTKDSGLAS